jgi:hypothetical protein
MRKTSIDIQYQAYLKKYYEALNEYNMDFIRPLTKGEYKNARASYIADKQAEGKTVFPSNINRDLVNRAKDYAMTPEQARAYKKGLEEMGVKIKYKTLRTNKAIKSQLDENIKDFYNERKKKFKQEGKEIPTKDIALEIGEYFFGS